MQARRARQQRSHHRSNSGGPPYNNILGLAYPYSISSYLWVCYSSMIRRHLSTHMGAQSRWLPCMLTIGARRAAHVRRQISSHHGRVTNHGYEDTGLGNATGDKYPFPIPVQQSPTKPPSTLSSYLGVLLTGQAGQAGMGQDTGIYRKAYCCFGPHVAG